jgi:hypothetical protein
MRKLALAALCGYLAFPRGARAESAVDPFLRPEPQGPPESGITLGARVGFGAPLGRTTQGNDLSRTFSGSIPLQIDAGWRFNPNLYAGIYFQAAAAQLDGDLRQGQGCDADGVSCSSSDLRLGVDVAYTFLPQARLSPWLGFGAGFESAKISVSQGGSSSEFTWKGFELAHVTAGLDVRLWPTVRFGPFANATLARFTAVDSSFDASQKAFHGWFQLGIRAAVDL